jgi:protocatechuate 3,4-dioxygenase beta subunit
VSRSHDSHLSRRRFLGLSLAVSVPLAVAGCGATGLGEVGERLLGRPARAQTLAPTPACGDGDAATLSQTEGPYYTRNTPERTSLLEPGVTGTRLVLSGYVLTRACQPIARALLDFWQTDGNGQYDNVGYRMRGHQFTDETGRYYLETVVPGLYPGRTRHIHVKAQAPNQQVLTTQLYFPGEARNSSDGIFRPALLLAIEETAEGQVGRFDFVLNVR